MKTKLLYQEDSYIKEFEATVLDINGNEVILDQTAFHNGSGGIQADTGWIFFDKEIYNVSILKKNDETIHVLDRKPSFKIGDLVKAKIDWEKRYKKMKLHTAAHIISSIMYNKFNALISGGEITFEYARDDFLIPQISSPDLRNFFESVIEEANKIALEGKEVKIYWLEKEKALNIPGIVKLAKKNIPDVEKIRIVEIEGVDVQADGGPHVKNTKEIGFIKLLKVENKGKNSKRIYYTVE